MGEEDGFWKSLGSAAKNGQDIQFVLHDDPDPDALISAYAMQQYCKDEYGVTPRIYYAGEINGKQNKHLANELALDNAVAEKYDDDFPTADTGYTVLVDNEGGSNVKAVRNQLVTGDDIDAIIDHHDRDPGTLEQYDIPAEQVVVRDDDTGSTATLVAEHFLETGYLEDYGRDRLAAFLRFAIETDTLGTYNAYLHDHKVYHDLVKYEDRSLHESLRTIYETPDAVTLVDEKEDDRERVEIMSIGNHLDDNADTFRVADAEIKRLIEEDPDKDTYVIVYSITESADGETIELSARASTGDEFSINDYLAKMGEIGEKYCGGKSGPKIHEGGGSIPVDSLEALMDADIDDIDPEEQFAELLHNTYIGEDRHTAGGSADEEAEA